MLSENTPSNQLPLRDSNLFHGSMSFFFPARFTCMCTCPSVNLPTWSVHVSSGGTQEEGKSGMRGRAAFHLLELTVTTDCHSRFAFPGFCCDCNNYLNLFESTDIWIKPQSYELPAMMGVFFSLACNYYSVLEIRCNPWIKALKFMSSPLLIYRICSLEMAQIHFHIFYLVWWNLY